VEAFDPEEHTVDDVNAYLAGVDDEEKFRVLETERQGRNRKGITEGPFATAPATVEDQLKEVRSMSMPMEAVAGNQQPITVTNSKFNDNIVTYTVKVQPTVGLDGGDGTRPDRATKLADNVWTPFKPPASFQSPTPPPNYIWTKSLGWVAAAYNARESTTNDTADMPGTLTLY